MPQYDGIDVLCVMTDL